MATLTEEEAYLAMFAFLESRWNITNSPDIGNCLSDMSLLADGTSADPAVKDDWLKAVELATSGKVDTTSKLR